MIVLSRYERATQIAALVAATQFTALAALVLVTDGPGPLDRGRSLLILLLGSGLLVKVERTRTLFGRRLPRTTAALLLVGGALVNVALTLFVLGLLPTASWAFVVLAPFALVLLLCVLLMLGSSPPSQSAHSLRRSRWVWSVGMALFASALTGLALVGPVPVTDLAAALGSDLAGPPIELAGGIAAAAALLAFLGRSVQLETVLQRRRTTDRADMAIGFACAVPHSAVRLVRGVLEGRAS